jgi:hypothetical protein
MEISVVVEAAVSAAYRRASFRTVKIRKLSPAIRSKQKRERSTLTAPGFPEFRDSP